MRGKSCNKKRHGGNIGSIRAYFWLTAIITFMYLKYIIV